MTMLPDVDETSYDEYQQQQLQQQLAQKQQSFGLDQAIGSKIADFTGWANAVQSPFQQSAPAVEAAPPPPEPAPPEPQPAPQPTPPPPTAPPEPTPAPEVLPPPSQEPPAVAPEPAPTPMATAAPTPTPRPTSSPTPSAPPSDMQDWITHSMNAVIAAGGDVRAYANKLSTQGDVIGNAISAAAQSGANVQDFASGLAPIPVRPAPGAPTSTTAGPGPTVDRGGDLHAYARQAAQFAGIDPDIFEAQIQQESGFNPSAKSGAGAIGIAQFMPGTAAGMKVDPTDPYAALDAAARMDSQNLQRYGGDYAKTLAAYNAGSGAVDKYGGVPPFEETQRYVKTIMGSGKQLLQNAGQAVQGAVKGAASAISQFGDSQLSADEAYAACGPAAAVRFAQAFGRNPTLREATDLAKSVGWTSAQGMAGISSEKALMDKLGVSTRLVGPDNMAAIAAEAQTGNPVTISTQGHYFTADGYDPGSGAFHVGRSGTDLRGGSEWMTAAQMSARMGPIQGALLADNPQVPAASTTDPTQGFQRQAPGAEGGPPQYTDFGQAAAASGPTSAEALKGMYTQSSQSNPDLLSNLADNPLMPSNILGGAERAAGQALQQGPLSNPLVQAAGGLRQQLFPTIFDPGVPEKEARDQALIQSGMQKMLQDRTAELSPEEHQALADMSLRVGGMEMPETSPEAARAVTQAARSGEAILGDALDQLRNYPPDTAQPIADWIAQSDAQGIPRSQIGGTVQRWMQENPLAQAPQAVQAAPQAVQAAVSDSLDAISRRMRPVRGPSGAGPEPGQLPLLPDQPYQPLLGEGGGAPGVPTVAPGRPRTSIVEQNPQLGLPEGTGAPGAPEVPAGDTGPTLDQLRMQAEQRRINAQQAARGFTPAAAEPLPADLTQNQIPGLLPPEVSLPKWIPQPVQDLVQRGRLRVPEGAALDTQGLQDLADKAGTTVDRIQRVWKADQPEAQASVQALGQALDDSAANLARLQQTLKLDPTHAPSITEMVQQLTRHQALQEAVAGLPPEAGAALKKLTQPTSLSGQQAGLEQLGKIADRFGGMTPEELSQHLASVDLTNPDTVSNLAQISRGYNFGDKVAAAWYFAMLSSPLTHIRNTIGNTAVALTRPGETAVAAGFDPLARKILGDTGPRQRYIGEAGQELAGMVSSIPEGMRQGWQALREGWVPETTGGFGQFNREAFRGTPLEALGYPGRALQAEDQFYRAMNEGASKFSLAYREAKQQGLKGAELADEWARLVANPTTDMQAAMDKAATYRTFQQDSKFSEWLNVGRQRFPALRYVLPFTRTPINIAKFAGERSPLGLAKLGLETVFDRQGLQKAGSGELADRMSRAAIGSATWGGVFMYALQGNLTGAAPSDPAERDAFYRDGKQPYAFRLPGTDKWIGYNALSPYSMLLSTAADTADAYRTGGLKDPNDLLAISSTMSVAIGRAMVNQSWTQGFSDLLDAWGTNGPQSGDKVGAWVARQAGGLVPGAFRDAARTIDPIIRDPQNPLEAIGANLPGVSRLVPPRLNAFGQEQTRPNTGPAALLNPFPVTSDTTDPVELELQRLQKGGYKVEPGLVGGNVQALGQSVDLTDDQQRRYQASSGALAKSILNTMVGTPEWDSLSDPDKAKFVDGVVSDMRSAMRDKMTPELVHQAAEAYRRQLEQRASVATPSATPTAAASTPVPAGAE